MQTTANRRQNGDNYKVQTTTKRGKNEDKAKLN